MLVKLSKIIKKALEDEVFPGAVAGISYKNTRYIISAGYRAITPFLEPMEEDNIFDLASLTKPLALAFTFMYFSLKDPRIDILEPISKYIKTKNSLGKIPVFRFLNHTSGLPAWYPLYRKIRKDITKKNALEIYIKKIETLPFEYEPGKKSVYSDLGYFILTYLLEKVYEKSFEELFQEAKSIISFNKRSFLDFTPLKKGILQEKIVPTSVCPWTNKILRGIVEDENTRALGGVSGVAGLFGNIYGVLDTLEFFKSAYKGLEKDFPAEIITTFLNFRENNSEYVLGFMLPNKEEMESLKKEKSFYTFKHTGFTGCSFWIDLKKDLIVVLLSNRVHPSRDNIKIRKFRPYFYKAVSEEIKTI